MEKLDRLVDPGLLRATIESDRLKLLISHCVPAEAVDQILHVRLSAETLKVVVANSAWAARLRFHSRELQQLFSTNDIAVSTVKIHVLPANAVPPLVRSSARKRPSASQHTVSNICQVADEIERNDPSPERNGSVVRHSSSENTLGVALRRLAKNLEDTNG